MFSKVDKWLYEKNVYSVIKKIIDHWLTTVIIYALIGLNAYILYIINSETAANGLKQNFKFFADVIFNHSTLIIFLSSTISVIYSSFKTFIYKKCENLEEKYRSLNKKYEIVLTILEKLESVVVEKRKRFALHSKQFISAPQTPKHKTVFDKITLPNKQIELLNEALRDYLCKTYPKDYIKVALMRVNNNKIDGWVSHSPYDTRPKTSLTDLQLPNSTFSKCIELNKTILVENTKVELKKAIPTDRVFIQGKTDPNEAWCQICVPIHSINNNEIIFIISIAIKRENIINQENLQFFEWSLKFFKSRLALEHSLAELKDKISPVKTGV